MIGVVVLGIWYLVLAGVIYAHCRPNDNQSGRR